MSRKIFPNLLKAGLLLLSAIAVIKMIFFGLDIDEEYAVVMSYRMLAEDSMLLEMWEPHQTSGFVCAFFIKIYLLLFGSAEYLVIYLRIVGVGIQALVSWFLYRTIRKYYAKEAAFWAALMSFTLLPKWVQLPEFSNILLWSNLCVMSCLLRFAKDEKRKQVWLLAAGVFFCFMILAYPSCILITPVYLWGIARQSHTNKAGNLMWFLGTCVVIGCGYIGFFLTHMSVEQFLHGIKQMSTDGKHAATFWEKISGYGMELWERFPLVLGVVAVAGILWAGMRFVAPLKAVAHTKGSFVLLTILVAHLHQFLVWINKPVIFNEPLVFFFFAFLLGVLFIRKDSPLVIFGVIPSIAVLLAVLIVTNTTISVSGSNLLPGILAGGILLWEQDAKQSETKSYRYALRFTGVVMLGLLLFAKGYLLRESGGYLEDIFYTKQKALSGPAKNIYCRYVDGYEYNNLAGLIEDYVTEEDCVLYVGSHNLRYLLTEASISTYSTISTPTYDERLLEYWEEYPWKYPTIVIMEVGAGHQKDVQALLNLGELLAETGDVQIYKVIP